MTEISSKNTSDLFWGVKHAEKAVNVTQPRDILWEWRTRLFSFYKFSCAKFGERVFTNIFSKIRRDTYDRIVCQSAVRESQLDPHCGVGCGSTQLCDILRHVLA